MGESKTIETRSFGDLWRLEIIDHEAFMRKSRAKNIPDNYIYRYASGLRRPGKAAIPTIASILKAAPFNLNVGQGQFLFPKVK